MGLFDLFAKKELNKNNQSVNNAPIQKSNANNEYANAVFLNMHKAKWRKPHTLEDTAHLAHKTHKFGVNDPVKKHNDMLRDGYFCEATSAEILNTYRLAELQGMAEKYSLSSEGRKADLIKLILNEVPIRKLKLPTMYFISDKGMEYIEKHKNLIKIFENPYKITYEEYMDAKNELPSYLSHDDIMWSVLGRRERTFGKYDDMSRRYNAFYRAEFLRREGKVKTALIEYLTVAYYDIEYVLDTFEHVPLSKFLKEKLLPPETALDPSLVNVICELKEHYEESYAHEAHSRAFVHKRHITHEQYCSYVKKLFATKDSDFSQYVPK